MAYPDHQSVRPCAVRIFAPPWRVAPPGVGTIPGTHCTWLCSIVLPEVTAGHGVKVSLEPSFGGHNKAQRVLYGSLWRSDPVHGDGWCIAISTARNSPPSTLLPPEIVDLIMNSRRNYRTLQACSLVVNGWAYLNRKNMFRSVVPFTRHGWKKIMPVGDASLQYACHATSGPSIRGSQLAPCQKRNNVLRIHPRCHLSRPHACSTRHWRPRRLWGSRHPRRRRGFRQSWNQQGWMRKS